MLDLIYKRSLTGVLMLLVVRKIHITHPFPRTLMTQRRKKITPNKSTIRGCWGGYLTQWSMLITSRRSSGKWSIWVAPKCFGHKKFCGIFYFLFLKQGMAECQSSFGLKYMTENQFLSSSPIRCFAWICFMRSGIFNSSTFKTRLVKTS